MPEQLANLAITTLALSMAIGDTTATLTDASLFSSAPTYRVAVGQEICTATGKAANVLTGLTRGAEGTTPAAHPAGDTIAQVLTAAGLVAAITDLLPPTYPPARANKVTITSGDITKTNTTWSEISTSARTTIPATAGDWLIAIANAYISTTAAAVDHDWVTIVSGAILNHWGTGTLGVSSMRWGANAGGPLNGTHTYEVQSGDIVAGLVTVNLAMQLENAGSRLYQANSALPFQFAIYNIGNPV